MLRETIGCIIQIQAALPSLTVFEFAACLIDALA